MRALVFGEILWDVFPDQRTIGGAPLNFAAHLQRLGCEAVLISAVGDDPLGRETLDAVRRFGLRSDGIAALPLSTGQAVITLDAQGTPSFDLISGVAYDRIPLPAAEILTQLRSGQFDAFYFGTLAQRAPGSSETLRALLDVAQVRTVFCDLNIRQSFYSTQSIRLCLEHATLLKLSRDEAAVLTELGLIDFVPSGTAADARRIGQALRRQFPQLEQLLLTLDADGAAVWEAENGALYCSAKPQVTVAATVGGGDSFGACYLRHFLAGLPAPLCLQRAVTLSNYVVTQMGAIPDYPPALRQALGMEAPSARP